MVDPMKYKYYPVMYTTFTALKSYEPDFTQQGRTLVGDRGYISTEFQYDLFIVNCLELIVP